jgi:uncharacterized protein
VTTVKISPSPPVPPASETSLAPGAALYECRITHVRTAPVRHQFHYRSYQWLVDLDHLPRPGRVLGLLAGFQARDHLGDPDRSLRANLDHFLAGHGVDLHGGQVLMLAHARVFGYVFNPLTVYWCHRPDGALACVVAEVHNTYGERHAYLLRPDAAGGAVTGKHFYVSPFFDVSGTYELRFTLRPDLVATTVTLRHHDAVAFSAAFRGRPEPVTRLALGRRLIRQPFMPQRVSALIRVHGIWLWLRGLPVRTHPHHIRQEGV